MKLDVARLMLEHGLEPTHPLAESVRVVLRELATTEEALKESETELNETIEARDELQQKLNAAEDKIEEIEDAGKSLSQLEPAFRDYLVSLGYASHPVTVNNTHLQTIIDAL